MEPFGPKDVTPLPGAEPREDFDVNRKSVEAEGPHGEPALAPVPLESPPNPATGKSTVEAEAFTTPKRRGRPPGSGKKQREAAAGIPSSPDARASEPVPGLRASAGPGQDEDGPVSDPARPAPGPDVRTSHNDTEGGDFPGSMKRPRAAVAVGVAAIHAAAAEELSDTESGEGEALYRVQLRDNPELVVSAGDRLGAIEEYKRRCGIVSTVHNFSVAEAGEDERREDDGEE
jgi:hypothetical protein